MYYFYEKHKEFEICYNTSTSSKLDTTELNNIMFMISDNENIRVNEPYYTDIIEYGPLLNFESPWSINAKLILHNSGFRKVERIEKTIRYRKNFWNNDKMDPILETIYDEKIKSFKTDKTPDKVSRVNFNNFDKINKELCLSLDNQDLEYYKDLFQNKLKREPTNVELFDLSQSNSEHSRHWFFKGRLFIDGKEVPKSLFETIMSTLPKKSNSLIAFCDNSSAIKGYKIRTITPSCETKQYLEQNKEYNISFTAETHNFPTGIAPFPGAATGTGGRIRDNQAIGRGGLIIAGTAGYCVGKIHLDNWVGDSSLYKKLINLPCKILIEASNGASDYGNKIGEPIIQGFARSFGMTLYDKERIEWLKPIMFTGGIGQIKTEHLKKAKPQKGMLIVRLGGPAYRIGVGGGSASSRVQDNKNKKFDMCAVQRGDPEMENKLNRVIRTCIEMNEDNPIVSIHDQGAGGMANVTKEIVEPAGGRVNIRDVQCGDTTLSVLEIWTAEYQECDTILIYPENKELISKICTRENLPVAFVGEITGDGKIQVYDVCDHSLPVDLDLDLILGKVPRKKYDIKQRKYQLCPFIPPAHSITSILNRVLSVLSVGSKRFLTNKVDRSVTGLIAQQQCIGPLHVPLSDYAIIAQSHFGKTGAVTSIGERPIISLISPVAMARMSIGEMLTNMMWVKISDFNDIKCSGNWMWPLKHDGEKYALYESCQAMCNMMKDLGISLDGGKDSLSMSTEIDGEVIKSPRTLVMSGYVTCPDITTKVTAEFKNECSNIIYVDLSGGKLRMGGSTLAHVYKQLGDKAPDVEDVSKLKSAFILIQQCIEEGVITAGHDKSDGGLITTLIEMCLPTNLGCALQIESNICEVQYLFNEELGFVVEVQGHHMKTFCERFLKADILFHTIGTVTKTEKIVINYNNDTILDEDVRIVSEMWEKTSLELELKQCNPQCVIEEEKHIRSRQLPYYNITKDVIRKLREFQEVKIKKYKVGIVREEGSNGDREMASAFYIAGFNVVDITMNDLINDNALDNINGVVFVGGFSYSDVFGAAKGWFGHIMYNAKIREKLQKFFERPDTFSLGVCNGCQLMVQLGLVNATLKTNTSGRFESRFSTVKIAKNNSIMLRDMEGCSLGVWVAHKEGKFESISIPTLQYVDTENNATEEYPDNPNGSRQGVAGVCSDDGRHLAMMPHPERTFLTWQAPWVPPKWRENKYYPWILMFHNAYQWLSKL